MVGDTLVMVGDTEEQPLLRSSPSVGEGPREAGTIQVPPEPSHLLGLRLAPKISDISPVGFSSPFQIVFAIRKEFRERSGIWSEEAIPKDRCSQSNSGVYLRGTK